ANGRIVACGIRDQTVVVWELLSGKRLSILEGHHAAVGALCFPAIGKGLYTAGADRRIIEWDLSGKQVRVLPDLPLARRRFHFMGGPQEAVFSGGGDYLATCERYSSTILVRDLQTDETLVVSRNDAGGLSSLAFSHDGKLLA